MTDAHEAIWRWWFGLTDYEAMWLGFLYYRGAEWASVSELQMRFTVSAPQVRVQISRLRAALEPEAIDSAPGLGYRLTDVGLGECRGALWKMGEELSRA